VNLVIAETSAEELAENVVTSTDISYTTTGRVAKFNIDNINGGFTMGSRKR
jgi:hypothetical protein